MSKDLVNLGDELTKLNKIKADIIVRAIKLLRDLKLSGKLTQECIDYYYWDSDFPDEALVAVLGVNKDIYIRKYLSERELTVPCPGCKDNTVQIKVRLKEEITSKRLRTERCIECLDRKEAKKNSKIIAKTEKEKEKPNPKHTVAEKQLIDSFVNDRSRKRKQTNAQRHDEYLKVKIGHERLQELRNMPYGDYLQTDHWKEVSRKAREAVGYKCERCNKSGVSLDVHHKSYERLGKELPCDLLVVCRPCHERIHGRKFETFKEESAPYVCH